VKDDLRNGLKQTRLRLGLSQQEVAKMVGVSRQTISGVESGQTALSVTVALRLSKALGCRVEDLFWLDQDTVSVEAVPAQSMASGELQRVSLAKISGRWVAHPLVGADAFRMELIPADGEAIRQPGQDTMAVTLLDEPANLLNTVVVAGCSPALSLWARAAERWHPELRVHLTFANSTIALERLMRGEVHIAGVHLFSAKTQSFNVPFVQQALKDQAAVLINLGVWEEGLLVAPGNPKKISTVQDLQQSDVALINREEGAGSRHLLDQSLSEASINPEKVDGYDRIAYSHEAVAQAILDGKADVGVSAASVASMFKLDFVPLRKAHYDLVTFKSYLEEPPVQQLLGTLGHRRVISQLEILGGYDTQLTGEVIATVKAKKS
jgi:putative molybdopterin biosynthesis protein